MVLTMKKIVSLTLILSLLLLALTSCGEREKVDISGATDLGGLRGATLAAQTGTFHLDALNEQTEGVTVMEYPDFTKLLIALNAGTIDGYVAEEPTALAIVANNEGLDYLRFVNNENGFTATDSETGIAVAFKTGSNMISAVDPIIDGISQETRAALMEQMVTASQNPDTALGEDIVLSSNGNSVGTSKGTLKVAMECAYAPYNWSQYTDANGAVRIANSTTGLYANGYDVQIAKYIAAELGYDLEIYEAKWEALITGVNAGTFDAVIAGMSPTAERDEEVDFTHCYYNSNLVVIYKKSK